MGWCWIYSTHTHRHTHLGVKPSASGAALKKFFGEKKTSDPSSVLAKNNSRQSFAFSIDVYRSRNLYWAPKVDPFGILIDFFEEKNNERFCRIYSVLKMFFLGAPFCYIISLFFVECTMTGYWNQSCYWHLFNLVNFFLDETRFELATLDKTCFSLISFWLLLKWFLYKF